MRRLRHTHDKLKIFIKETIDSFINEIYETPIETKYEKILFYYSNGFFLDTYRFKTNSNSSYDLDFVYDVIDPNIITLPDESTRLSTFLLKNYIKPTIVRDIGFTPTEIKDLDIPDEIIGSLDDPYITKTNKNEQYELLNRVAYLIQEYIKNNPKVYIYSVGKNTDKSNLNVYNYIFNKIFSNNFKMFDVENPDYKHGSFYFINKKTLK